MENYLDIDLTDKIGLAAFNLSILKEINLTIEIIRTDFLTTYGWAYELRNRFYDYYVPEMQKYKWGLKEKLKNTNDKLKPEHKNYLNQIPFLEYSETNLTIKYKTEWKSVILTKTHLILI